MNKLAAIILTFFTLTVVAQTRTVTPIVPVTSRPVAQPKVKKEKPAHSERPASVVEMTDDLGNTVLLDTLNGNEWVDSLALAQPKVIGNIYPLMDAVSVGADLWPLLNRGIGFYGRLSLHNRYFPVFEAGFCSARNKPDGLNYTYKQKLAPYFKLGIDYNFFYNSNPGYQLFALLRYGLSHFSYDINDVTLDDPYWQESITMNFPTQTTTTGYLELGVGLNVKIWGPISAGWNVRYHKVLHHSKEPNGAPWYVPGMGKRASSLGVQVTLSYTLPLHSPIPNPSETPENKKK